MSRISIFFISFKSKLEMFNYFINTSVKNNNVNTNKMKQTYRCIDAVFLQLLKCISLQIIVGKKIIRKKI